MNWVGLFVLGAICVGIIVICSSKFNALENIFPNKSKDITVVVDENDNQGISFLPLEVKLTVLSYEQGKINAQIDNQSGYTMSYGNGWALYTALDEEYVLLIDEETTKIMELEDLQKVDLSFDVSSIEPLCVGKYMLVIDDLKAEFEMK